MYVPLPRGRPLPPVALPGVWHGLAKSACAARMRRMSDADILERLLDLNRTRSLHEST